MNNETMSRKAAFTHSKVFGTKIRHESWKNIVFIQFTKGEWHILKRSSTNAGWKLISDKVMLGEKAWEYHQDGWKVYEGTKELFEN